MKKPKSVDEYIEGFTGETRLRLEKMRGAIQRAAPKSVEVISYSMPGYRQNGMLVWFAGFKNHTGFYPGADGIARFKEELSEYKYAKGSVQFPHDKPLPLTLITRIVKYRVQEKSRTN